MSQKYKWTLDRDVTFKTGYRLGAPFSSEWVHITGDGVMTVRKGYSWNGSTPYLSVFDLFAIGTPDGVVDYRTGKQKLYYPTLKHDASNQFREGAGLALKEINAEFLRDMREVDFACAWLYWAAVSIAMPIRDWLRKVF